MLNNFTTYNAVVIKNYQHPVGAAQTPALLEPHQHYYIFMQQLNNLVSTQQPYDYSRVTLLVIKKAEPLTSVEEISNAFSDIDCYMPKAYINYVLAKYPNICSLADVKSQFTRVTFTPDTLKLINDYKEHSSAVTLNSLAQKFTEDMTLVHLSEINSLLFSKSVCGLAEFVLLEGKVALLIGGLTYLSCHKDFLYEEKITEFLKKSASKLAKKCNVYFDLTRAHFSEKLYYQLTFNADKFFINGACVLMGASFFITTLNEGPGFLCLNSKYIYTITENTVYGIGEILSKYFDFSSKDVRV